MTLTVAFVASPQPWRRDWVAHLHSFAVNERVAAVIGDRRDLYNEEWRVLLIDASSSWLTAEFVEGVHEHGRGVIAVHDPADQRRKRRALDAGVDVPLESDADPAALLAAIHGVGRDYPGRARATVPRPSRRTVRPGGQVIAVGGPPGSRPDRVAIGLAQVLSAQGQRVALVDANDVDPCIVQQLDLHPHPNIATAASRAEGAVPSDLQSVDGAGFTVLAGLHDPAQWSTVNGRGARRAIDSLAADHDRVVVCVGPMVESLGRFGLTLAMLAHAEAVVPVGQATPHDLAAMTAWMAGAVEAAPEAAFYPTATYVKVTRYEQAEVDGWLDKLAHMPKVCGPGVVALLPAPDRREDGRRWDGRVWRSGGRGALGRLATEVTT